MNYPKTRKAALKYFKAFLALDTTDNTTESLLAALNCIETTLQEFKVAFVEEDTINSPQNRALVSPWDDGILIALELPKSADILKELKTEP